MIHTYFHTPKHQLIRLPLPVHDVMVARNQARFHAAYVYNADVRRVFAVVPRSA